MFQFFFQELIVNFFIILTSIFFLTKVSFLKHVKLSYAIFIYFYHSIFMIIMIFYTFKNPGDSNFMWKSVDYYNFDYFLSSGFMQLILFILKNIIHLSYSNLILLINLVGTLGLLFFFDFLFSKLSKKNIALVFLIILLPSLHLWTNTYIKDSLILTLLFVFIWLESQRKNYDKIQFITIIFIFLIRPYLGILFLFPFLVKIYMKSNNKILFLLPYISFSILILFFLFNFFSHHAIEISSFNPFEIIGYILEKYENIQHGSTYINTDKFFFINMFSYLFAPIFYPILSIDPVNIVLICEGIILIILLSYLIFNFKYNINFVKLLYIFSLVILLYIVAMTTTNVGIVIRQKWTIIIFLLYILVDGYQKKT